MITCAPLRAQLSVPPVLIKVAQTIHDSRNGGTRSASLQHCAPAVAAGDLSDSIRGRVRRRQVLGGESVTKQVIVRGLLLRSALLVFSSCKKGASSATAADARVAVLESGRLVAKRSARIPFTAGELSW